MSELYVLDCVFHSGWVNVQATQPSPPNYVVSEFVKNTLIMADHGKRGFCEGRNRNVSAGQTQNDSTVRQHFLTKD